MIDDERFRKLDKDVFKKMISRAADQLGIDLTKSDLEGLVMFHKIE